jgi:hypothetical protein
VNKRVNKRVNELVNEQANNLLEQLDDNIFVEQGNIQLVDNKQLVGYCKLV